MEIPAGVVWGTVTLHSLCVPSQPQSWQKGRRRPQCGVVISPSFSSGVYIKRVDAGIWGMGTCSAVAERNQRQGRSSWKVLERFRSTAPTFLGRMCTLMLLGTSGSTVLSQRWPAFTGTYTTLSPNSSCCCHCLIPARNTLAKPALQVASPCCSHGTLQILWQVVTFA